MDFSECKGVYVVAEIRDGRLLDVTKELLGQARKIADVLHEKTIVLAAGYKIREAAEALIPFGADEVYVFDNELLNEYHAEAYGKVLGEFLKKEKPDIVLVGATANGRDLAPRLSAALVCGVTADVTELSVDEKSGLVVWSRPAMGNNIFADIVSPDFRPQMGTVRPGVFAAPAEDRTRTGKITDVPVQLEKTDIHTVLRELICHEKEEDPVEDARIVVTGGRGIRDEKTWQQLHVLADLLGGTVGATRPVCELGWEPHSRQIGQTGKHISPKIYFAFGVSGAMQHVCGVKADVIIAVNRDPQAPIFDIADYAVVADADEFLPAMIREAEALKKQEIRK